MKRQDYTVHNGYRREHQRPKHIHLEIIDRHEKESERESKDSCGK